MTCEREHQRLSATDELCEVPIQVAALLLAVWSIGRDHDPVEREHQHQGDDAQGTVQEEFLAQFH